MAKSLLDSAKALPRRSLRHGPAAWHSRLDPKKSKQIDEIIEVWLAKTPWLLEKLPSRQSLADYIVEKAAPGVQPKCIVDYIRKREAERGKQKRS